MGLIKAFSGALSGNLADQWLDIIVPSAFDEYSAVVPGVFKNNGSQNTKGAQDVISSGSKIFVPENVAAFIFSQDGIEEVITEAGGYEYQNGQSSVFNGDGIEDAMVADTVDRFKHGGQTSTSKRVAYVNLHEIRNIKFGTRGPVLYNDLYYGVDLEIRSYGTFSVQIKNPEQFIRNFVPANTNYYSFNMQEVREQLVSEFLQSFVQAMTQLSDTYRISKITAHSDDMHDAILQDSRRAGTWLERFGFELTGVGIANIELTDASRELIKQYSTNKMNTKAYEEVSDGASNRAAQQKIASGVEENGFGEGVNGMLFGMNYTQGLGADAQRTGTQPQQQAQPQQSVQPQQQQVQPEQQQQVASPEPEAPASGNAMESFEDQVNALNQLKQLLDAEILTQEEFDIKKKDRKSVV